MASVSYHGCSLYVLVEVETPERAIGIARAYREAKRLTFRSRPSKTGLDITEFKRIVQMVQKGERDAGQAKK
ncbi:MAG: hypothetical protein V3R74_08740, partial [Alphaproteobacteria bacterium]